MWCFLVFVVIFGNCASAIDNYCSTNTYNDTFYNGFGMQFTKEANSVEFALVGMFKSLHCCARGYKSIEWYKDDKVYPWPVSASKLILYPEGANQTIYVQNVREDDAGNYTCVLRNDTVSISHTILLRIYDKTPDDPQITYISEDKEIARGQELRLFCEAFAGRVDLPDARSEAVWLRANYNGTFDNDTRIVQDKSSREDHQTFGRYLVINEVTSKDFGEYICKFSYAGSSLNRSVRVTEKIEVIYMDPNPIPVTKLILFASCVGFLIVVLILLNLKYGLALRVRFKDSFGPLEDLEGGITSDLLIVYSEKDAELALGVLLPTLETRYRYRCASRQLPTSVNQWYANLQTPAQSTKRLVALLSPEALEGNWDGEHILTALKQLQSVGPPLCCITLSALPGADLEPKNTQGETMRSVCRTLGVIEWERGADDRFWLSLRLLLPPNRGRLNLEEQPVPKLVRESSLDNLV